MKYVIQVDMYQIHVAFPAKNTVHSDTENKLITNLKKWNGMLFNSQICCLKNLTWTS